MAEGGVFATGLVGAEGRVISAGLEGGNFGGF